MAQKYGNTWWGEQWLKSLSHIDYSNRLPRGRTYANKGAVTSIQFNDNVINAKVQGTRARPYRIEIVIPKFSLLQKRKIIDSISENSLILAKLLNRQLPDELMQVAEKNGAKVFPSTWQDFDMACSCPDWAVPCKHLAAVLYVISSEIDKNPGIVFQLHGLDIFKELEKKGIKPDKKDVDIPEADSFYVEKTTVENDKIEAEKIDLYDFNLKAIPETGETLIGLLHDNPLFSDKDFKTILLKNYKRISKATKRYIKARPAEKTNSEVVRYRHTEVVLSNEFFYFDTIFFTDDEDEKHFSKQKGFEKLVAQIDDIPAKILGQLSQGVQALYVAYHFSLTLLEQGAFVPQLIKLNNGHYIIRWIPALMDKSVLSLFQRFMKITPPDIVQIADATYTTRQLEKREQAITLLSLFLDYFVHDFTEQHVNFVSKIDTLFFTYTTQAFDGLGEKEVPYSIHQWLSKFFISHKQFTPLIQIDELDDNYFGAKVLVENTQDALQQPVEVQQFLSDKQFSLHHIGILKDLSLLSEVFPDLEKILSTTHQEQLEYASDEFADILLRVMPMVKMHGIRVLLPKSVAKLIRPASSLALSTKATESTAKGYLSFDEMLQFNWRVALGDTLISAEEFFEAVQNMQGIVKIQGQYVYIEESEIEKLKKHFEKAPQVKGRELLHAALSEEYKGASVQISSAARKMIQQLKATDKVGVPENLNAVLRPYQARGFEWLYKNLKLGFGSIIADDMGLGKTIQVISILLKMKEEKKLNKKKALAIVPTTLLTNWQKEINKFAPSLQQVVYHGVGRKFEFDEADVVITTYGMVRSDLKLFKKPQWAVVIIDEAQNIKNPQTEQTKAVKKLKAGVQIAMSGTPVENRLSEYWSIFDFTNKGYLGSKKWFMDNFAAPIEMYRDEHQLEQFKKITSPFIIRRLKTDKSIIDDLPEKVENDVFAQLTKEQAALYASVVKEMMPEIEEAEQSGDDSGAMQKRGRIFKLMTALKQIGNHPFQFLKKGKKEAELSGKTQLLLNLLDTIYENGEKVLIFTQYKEMGKLLSTIISEIHNFTPLLLHGGVSRKKRDKMVEDFQTKNHINTFILSIKAGGTGLNLTEANHVIHYDLWWNPAVENQATDRAFRIGQTKNVMVYRLINQGTFEEKINQMLQDKKELADLTVSTGEKWIGDLSSKELRDLVQTEST